MALLALEPVRFHKVHFISQIFVIHSVYERKKLMALAKQCREELGKLPRILVWSLLYCIYLWAFARIVLVAGDWCHSQSLIAGLLHSLCVSSSAPVCAGGGEGLQGTEIHEFSPCRHSTDRDVWAVDMNGPRGDPKAVLPLPTLMLHFTTPEAARLRSKGVSSPSKSGEAAWVLSCPAWSSVLSELHLLVFQDTKWLCTSKSCLRPQIW